MTHPGTFHSIDPGVDYYALAEWFQGRLVGVGVYDRSVLNFCRGDLVVMERQQVYAHSKARKSDIVDLAISAGGLAEYYARAVWFLPAQWKGQVPKKAHQARIMSTGIGRPLDETEKGLILACSKKHQKDIIDAVGLGLYYMSVKGINVQH